MGAVEDSAGRGTRLGPTPKLHVSLGAVAVAPILGVDKKKNHLNEPVVHHAGERRTPVGGFGCLRDGRAR